MPVAMASTGRSLCFLLLIWFCVAGSGVAWKEAEFRKCHQSKFCNDVRERAAAWARGEGGREIEVRDVNLSGEGRVTARLIPAGNEAEALVLELSAYRDGIVRIKVVEEKAPRKRFEVPDVVVSDFEQKRLVINRIVNEGSASVVQLNGHDIIIQHKPFQVGDHKPLLISAKAEFFIADIQIHMQSICALCIDL